MVRAAPQNAGDVRAPRPCSRLHGSTYLVLLLTIALLVVLMAPGQVTMSVTGWGGHQNRFEHGWPWRYLTRSTYPDSTELLAIGSVPLHHRQCWSRQGRDIVFDKLPLAADIALAIGSLPVIAVAFEAWRRRRPRVVQFSTRQLAVAVVLCGITLTWWTSWQRRHAAVESSAHAVNKQSISFAFGYVGPTWLGRLTGGPEAFWEPEGLLVFGEDGCNWMAHQARPHEDLCLSHVSDVSVITTALPAPTIEAIARLPALRSIRFPMCPAIGDHQCDELSRISGLRDLHLYGTSVSDAGLEKLGSLRQLRKLDIRGTRVTPGGVARLQQALPQLEMLADWTPTR